MTMPAQWGVGVLAAWLSFYLLGRLLADLPDTFHEGTFWKEVTNEATPKGL